jgi:hypothetical protein
MNVAETIQQKIVHLPPKAQAEVLEIIEQIEQRYQTKEEKQTKHPLTLIAEMAIDTGVSDLAERHDFYAHNKLED